MKHSAPKPSIKPQYFARKQWLIFLQIAVIAGLIVAFISHWFFAVRPTEPGKQLSLDKAIEIPPPQIIESPKFIEPPKQIIEEPVIDYHTEWKTALDTITNGDDIEALCVLLAAPPAEFTPEQLSGYTNKLFQQLLSGKTADAPPPPSVIEHSPPPLIYKGESSFQHVTKDPLVPGGWLGMTWKGFFRCGPDNNWRLTFNFLPPGEKTAIGYFRVDPITRPGLVTMCTPTKAGPGGYSHDGGETWTWLSWPKGIAPSDLIEMAPLNKDSFALSIRDRTYKEKTLLVYDKTKWTNIGNIHDEWTTIPLTDDGFIIDSTEERLKVRFWTTDGGWSNPQRIDYGWRLPAPTLSGSRNQPALLPDRCGIITNKGIRWFGAHGIVLQDIASPELARRAMNGACLAVNPNNPQQLWGIFHGHGLWHSKDGGMHWERGKDLLENLDARNLNFQINPDGTFLISDKWIINESEHNWDSANHTPTHPNSTEIAKDRSPQVQQILKMARTRVAEGRLSLNTEVDQTILDTVDKLRNNRDKNSQQEIVKRLYDSAVNGKTHDRINWIRFLLACAGDTTGKNMILKHSVSNDPPSPDERLLSDLFITPGDLVADQNAFYTLILARIRGLHALTFSDAGIVINRYGEAERLLQWLTACAPNDPLVFYLHAQLEIAIASVLQRATSVVLSERLKKYFGNRQSDLAKVVKMAISHCTANPQDQHGLQLLLQLACADASYFKPNAKVKGLSERLTTAVNLLTTNAKDLDPVHLSMDLLFLRSTIALLSLENAADEKTLALIEAVKGKHHYTDQLRGVRTSYMLQRLCRAIYTQTEKMKSDVTLSQQQLVWRQESHRLMEILPLMSYNKFNPLHIIIPNALALDLLTLPDRTLHNPAQALEISKRAVERDSRNNAYYLSTLALALCRNKDFSAAVRTQQEANDKLGIKGKHNIPAFEQRLALYQDLAAHPSKIIPDELFHEMELLRNTSGNLPPEPAPPPSVFNDF